MKRKNRMAATLLGVCGALLILSRTVTACLAITPPYQVSSAYGNSTYYKSLKNLQKTDDQAFDVLAVALSQLSYHEGNGTAQLGGKNQSGTKNYTEYNYALGQIGGSWSYSWCAAFVSWCLTVAGAGDSAGGSFASCTLWVEKLQSTGQYRTRSSGYTPKEGDIIFFKSADVTRVSNHVGLVRYVKGGRVYTVEGNSSDRVILRDYALSDTYIAGYGLPHYQNGREMKSHLALEDSATGLYTVTNSFVNVRADAASTATKRGTLLEGAQLQIIDIKNGWGAFYYNGLLSYVSLDYADFTAPVLHTVTYLYGETVLYTAEYLSTDTHTAKNVAPEREGYRFLFWQAKDGTRIKTGDVLSAGDTELSAVFEELPKPPAEENTPPPEAPNGEGETLFPAPPPEGDVILPPMGEDAGMGEGEISPTPNVEAARHAGVVTFTLSLSLSLLWFYLSKKGEA